MIYNRALWPPRKDGRVWRTWVSHAHVYVNYRGSLPAGFDTLLCLVNPYRIPHEAVMETIELMGTEVIPKFSG